MRILARSGVERRARWAPSRLLFTNEAGEPITEYLPEDHDGRRTWGLVKDPHPELGRPLRNQAAARERERRERKS